MASEPPARPQSTFSFLTLPLDLQIQILGALSPSALHNTTAAHPSLAAVFQEYPGSILKDTFSTLHPQLRNFLFTIHGIDSAIKQPNIYPRPKFEKMSKFLKKSLDEKCILQGFEQDPIAALERLRAIEDDVDWHMREYAQETYERICKHDDILMDDDVRSNFPPLKLSAVEEHRIKRAFYRLRLFKAIFYDYADHFKMDLRESYVSFFKRLSAFELDEFILLEMFCRRRRGLFLATCGHSECIHYGAAPWRRGAKPNWEQCMSASKDPGVSECLTDWRLLWPIRDTIEEHYIDGNMDWIDPTKCRETPSRLWDDVPEANDPNDIWRCCVKDIHVHRTVWEYQSDFQMLGFCFWDAQRVKNTWGDIFGKQRIDDWWRIYYFGKGTEEEIQARRDALYTGQ